MKRALTIGASAVLCALFVGVVLPVVAGWSRVEINGVSVCKDSASGATFKPPYSSKSDVTKACNVLTSFWPWLGTAEAAVIRTRCQVNPDGSCSLAWPNDSKPPSSASISFSASACATALAPIAGLTTSDTVAIDLDAASCTAGSDVGSATLTIDASASASNFSISGSYPHRTLARSSGIAGTGTMVLRLTYMGAFALSSTSPGTVYPWSVVAPPSADTLAPPVPVNLVATAGSGQVVITGDTPWDACGNENCKGMQDIQLQADGSGTLATVSVGPGFSCSPTKTNIGSAGSVSATQTGNDWSITSNGANDNTADVQEFVNCAFSGAGFVEALVDSVSGDMAGATNVCVERRAAQSDSGGIKISACVVLSPSDGMYYFDTLHRDAPNANRIHGPAVLIGSSLPCIRLAWDASNIHTLSYSTVTGGKCNNDWNAIFTNVALAFSATTYVGVTATSNEGAGASSTWNIKQLSINNASWTYTHTTSSSHTYAARARDRESTPNASAYSPTVSAGPAATSGLVKLRAGYYLDCYTRMPHGGDFQHYIGSPEYAAYRSCIDHAAANPPIKGVFLPLFWSSLEGDTAGSYDGSVGNALAPAGKIGFPLIHDMLNYAASKHMTVLLELDWFNYYSDPCQSGDPSKTPGTDGAGFSVPGLVPRYLLASSCNGTDAAGTYSGGIWPYPDAYTFYLKLWKPAVMDRWIALLNAYATEFDGDSALEGWILFGEEGDAPAIGSDYSQSALYAQFKRVVSEVKPNWPHTDILLATAWMGGSPGVTDILAEAATSPTKAIGIWSNDFIVQRTDYGQCAYLGVVNGSVCPNTGTHNYQGELSYSIWLGNPREMCPAPFPGIYGYLTFAQQYDALMNTGFTSSSGRPLKASRWILGNEVMVANNCPAEVTNAWGTIGGSGVYNYIQTHQINTACPSIWTGGCNTTSP